MAKKETPYTDAYKEKYYLKKDKASQRRENSKDIKKTPNGKPHRKTEHQVVVAIYLLVFLTVGYFLLVNINPNTLPNNFYSYKISASDSMIGNSLRSLYIKNTDALSKEITFENESTRLITTEAPFYFIFSPKRIIKENTTAKLELSFLGKGTAVYLNDKIIIPELKGFVRTWDFADSSIWVRNGTKNTYGDVPIVVKDESAEDFVYANYPGQDFYDFSKAEHGRSIIAGYNHSTTFIRTRFRGNLKLAIYINGNLNLRFIKQDLNWYIGKDEYTVKITDLQGNNYFNKTYPDDGQDKNSGKSTNQSITIKGKDLPGNIYYITFMRDKYNKAADSTINSISINTNKVLIIGKSLPLTKFKFYTKIDYPQKIGFNYWHNRKNQIIEINGTKNISIDLNKTWKGKRYGLLLDSGEYNIECPKGDLWVYTSIIAPSRKNWFYFPRNGDKNLIDQNIIIINKKHLKIKGNDLTWDGIIQIKPKDKIKLQVLDKLEIYFKYIKLSLAP